MVCKSLYFFILLLYIICCTYSYILYFLDELLFALDEMITEEMTKDANEDSSTVPEVFTLKTLVSGSLGPRSGTMYETLDEIHRNPGDHPVKIVMAKAITDTLSRLNGKKSKDDFRKSINNYVVGCNTETVALVPELNGSINFGDSVGEISAGIIANYATMKETVKPTNDDTGVCNLMHFSSAVIRYLVQSLPRSLSSAIREKLGLEYMKSTIVCNSIGKSDISYVSFDNPGNNKKKYYEIITKLLTAIKFKSKSEFFAVACIKFLMVVVDYRMDRIERDLPPRPLPLMCVTGYGMNEWFGNTGPGAFSLVNYVGYLWHPDYMMKKYFKSASEEAWNRKNIVIANFYLNVDEVRKALDAMLDLDMATIRALLENGSVFDVLARMSDCPTADERREQYERMLADCQRGGEECNRVTTLGRRLDSVGYDLEELTINQLKEYNYWLGKRQYKGDRSKLIANMRALLNNQNDLANLSKLASAANRGMVVDIEALAKSRRESVSKTRESLENTQRAQNGLVNLGRAASAARRGMVVDIEALAESSRKSVSKTRESLENTQRAQNNHADLVKHASAANRGKDIDIEALAKSRRESVSKTRNSLENTQRNQQ